MIEVSLDQTKNMQATECVRIRAETVVAQVRLIRISHRSKMAKSNCYDDQWVRWQRRLL